MLIGNFDKSLMCSEAVAPLFKNGPRGSFFACIRKPIVINVEPLFLLRCISILKKYIERGLQIVYELTIPGFQCHQDIESLTVLRY